MDYFLILGTYMGYIEGCHSQFFLKAKLNCKQDNFGFLLFPFQGLHTGAGQRHLRANTVNIYTMEEKHHLAHVPLFGSSRPHADSTPHSLYTPEAETGPPFGSSPPAYTGVFCLVQNK